MNRQRFSVQVLLYFFLIVFLMITGCGGGGGGDNGPAAPVVYFQSDLEGTWNFQVLSASADSTNKWMRGNVTIDTTGKLTFNDFEDSSTGSPSVPTGIVWTINGTTGAITETDNGTATAAHYTMTSNGNLIVGTATGSSELFIIQKVGTSYAASDITSKDFVYHQLSAGTSKVWSYGEGSTTGTNTLTISSETTPSGTTVSPAGYAGVTLSLNTTTGIVTMTGGNMGTFEGLLSSDKKTILGTYTSGSDYKLIVIQIKGQTYTLGNLPAGSWNAHGLVVGDGEYAPLWIHYHATIDGSGKINFSSTAASNSLVVAALPASYSGGSIDASGKITFTSDTTFNGQLSDDSTFMVATQTPSGGYFSLTIYTDVR